MSQWLFLDYQLEGGSIPFAEWLDQIEVPAKVFISTRMLLMEGMARWPEKWVSKFHGKSSLFELRIPLQKVQYRPLFIYSTHARGCLVLLSGAIEKGNKIPKSTIDNALERAKSYEKDPNRAVRHVY